LTNKILVGAGSNGLLTPSNLHWDTVNNRLGLGTNTPSEVLNVIGNTLTTGKQTAQGFAGIGSNITNLDMDNASLGILAVVRGGTGVNTHLTNKILVGAGSNELLTPSNLHWDTVNNRLGLGTNTPSEVLNVIGNTLTTGKQTAQGFVGIGSNITNLDMDNASLGILDVVYGGTGQSTLQVSKLLMGNTQNGIVALSNVHWDSNNQRLGINNSVPQKSLDVTGTIEASIDIKTPDIYVTHQLFIGNSNNSNKTTIYHDSNDNLLKMIQGASNATFTLGPYFVNQHYYYSSYTNSTLTTTASATLGTKLTYTTPISVPAGLYRMNVLYQVYSGGNNRILRTVASVNGTTWHDVNDAVANNTWQLILNSSSNVTLAAGPATLLLQYASPNANTVGLRRAGLEMWRLS
jgi:hypothetical protein